MESTRPEMIKKNIYISQKQAVLIANRAAVFGLTFGEMLRRLLDEALEDDHAGAPAMAPKWRKT